MVLIAGEFMWATVDTSAILEAGQRCPGIVVAGPEPDASKALQQLKQASGTEMNSLTSVKAVLSELAERLRSVAGEAWACSSADESSHQAECGICYAPISETHLDPTIMTDPRAVAAMSSEASAAPIECPGCPAQFHPGCISEWLRHQPSSRRAFAAVIGPCPYCSRDLTTGT